MRLRLTEAADRDIERILEDTLEFFGPNQLKAYSALIEQALGRVGTDPRGLVTSEREDIGPGVRSLRLADVARRRGAASHSLYFLPRADDADAVTVVLRVLHDRMEPRQRVALAILDRAPNAPPDEGDEPLDAQGASPGLR
ncbi:type II toxin-antitoxin system RelE/ParE family toxin [Antarcticirhabdus aurantiaca]|uniref:Type II toxin-antitoxin system RelE/ParE family toxin n=1 Tax=Antarcticirhabdus aurantiaca TaxID=2606717 RepID=A0ACD4NRX0_9HYPH|nr:type II toxin-antitoxin system RelE/ParE family toxin [Antarcticirhabdus aurantiaca]WAJ29458.1 type II toxin-antitoxin system RelE/ParE family toxin [Jeongeuplla avenae]